MAKPISLPALILIAATGLAAILPAARANNAPEPELAADTPSFQDWLADFRQQAEATGISKATLDATLTGLQPDPDILEHDLSQPEFVQTFWNYLDTRITAKRIATGKAMLAEHASLFAAEEKRYGVPARYLVAFWGLETNYGGYLGDNSIIQALATLAYDNRRASFFRAQLLNALRIVDSGNMSPANLRGSWAGAFGHMQFMPSTFLRYAVDGDSDGRIDIRDSLADAIDSAANYLQQMGWQSGQGWGEEVVLPKHFDWSQAQLNHWKTIRDWSALGVTRADGSALPNSNLTAAILLPQGHDGPAVLVQRNFNVMLRWNHSVNYALAVGLLADRLADKPGLANGRDVDNRRLSRDQVIDMQNCLATLGFDPGPVDGLPGRQTLKAIRAYQTTAGLPADGYASIPLLDRLHTTLQAKSLPLPSASSEDVTQTQTQGTL